MMIMQKERASKKQQELLSFVDGFIKGSGYGPSYREIMRALGYKSVSTVAIHIDNLIAKGYLARSDKSARSLMVVTTRPDETAPSVEAELLGRVKAEHTNEERLKIKQALELMGFESVAKKIEVNDEDNK